MNKELAIICDLEDALFTGKKINQSVSDLLFTYRHETIVIVISQFSEDRRKDAQALLDEAGMPRAVLLMWGGLAKQEAMEELSKLEDKYTPLFVICGPDSAGFWQKMGVDTLTFNSAKNER